MILTIDHVSPVLEAMEGHARNFVRDVARPVAEEVFVEAGNRVPVKTGRLKRSGRVVADADDASVVYGNGTAYYAGVVHERKPWLADAADAVGADAIVDRVMSQKV